MFTHELHVNIPFKSKNSHDHFQQAVHKKIFENIFSNGEGARNWIINRANNAIIWHFAAGNFSWKQVKLESWQREVFEYNKTYN